MLHTGMERPSYKKRVFPAGLICKTAAVLGPRFSEAWGSHRTSLLWFSLCTGCACCHCRNTAITVPVGTFEKWVSSYVCREGHRVLETPRPWSQHPVKTWGPGASSP